MKKPVIIRFTKEQSWREKLLLWLLGKVIPMHAFFYEKRKPWGMRTQHLLHYPEGSLGRELGLFLTQEKLQPIPKVERHDAFHILFDYDTKVHNEAAMQFFLIGNGKISPFTLGTAIFAGLILPEHWNYFREQFYRGNKAQNISKWDFKVLLDTNFIDLKKFIFNQSIDNPMLISKIATFKS